MRIYGDHHNPWCSWGSVLVGLLFGFRGCRETRERLAESMRADFSEVQGNLWGCFFFRILPGFNGILWWFNGIYNDLMGHEWDSPSGNVLQRYWTWPFLVSFPIENGGSFHSYVSLPEGIHMYPPNGSPKTSERNQSGDFDRNRIGNPQQIQVMKIGLPAQVFTGFCCRVATWSKNPSWGLPPRHSESLEVSEHSDLIPILDIFSGKLTITLENHHF